MTNQPVSNPKDYQVVTFHNLTDFGFTPDMGCMYDGRAINHPEGGLGIPAGKSMTLPYHIGHRLAVNLAKIVMIRASGDVQQKDAQGQPMIKSIWDDVGLEKLKNTYIVDLYSEEKPAAPSQTDLLMEKVEALNKMVLDMKGQGAEPVKDETVASIEEIATPAEYQDKAEVISELTKRGVKFDARKNKADLEKLLA